MNRIEFNYHLKKLNNSNDSLEAIYNFYYSRIISFITHKYDGGAIIAHDVAQEFFHYVIRMQNKPYVTYPTAWIYKCCDHIALKLLKVERKFSEIDESFVADTPNLEESMYGELDVYISQLDELTQKIIKMLYIDNYSALEISEILNVKYGTVRQKHARAIKKIKNLYIDVTKSKI